VRALATARRRGAKALFSPEWRTDAADARARCVHEADADAADADAEADDAEEDDAADDAEEDEEEKEETTKQEHWCTIRRADR